ncbi:hypothetical protein HKCCE2091_10035 [Rhodobacterales bacterium HKCCE2091]|nr:hypothetical protein [Rhodobacterales bacterium HKCCE2091]
MRGRTNYEAGIAAEDQVARLYETEGHAILTRRWRGKYGELDLVAEKDGEVIFIEVKKSGSFAEAALHLTQRQIGRIYNAASEYLGRLPTGQSTNSRFDVALVDRMGRIDRIPNAIMA